MAFAERVVTHDGLLRIEDCLDADGRIDLPAGVTLISLIDRKSPTSATHPPTAISTTSAVTTAGPSS
jgi:hypothetical protein